MMLLLLSWFLCVSADSLHEDIKIAGCSLTESDSEGEEMYGLDGEEKYYADFRNKKNVYPQPDFMRHISFGEGIYQHSEVNLHICRLSLKYSLQAHKNLPLQLDAPSSLMLYPRDKIELDVKNILICHVTGFYPAPVNITWTKNGENVTEGTSINAPWPNKDGSFKQISRLDFIPQQGDIYSCTVQHPALTQPLTKIWDVEKTLPSVGPAVFCGLGLTVGLLGVAAGTFFLVKGNEYS